MIHGISAAAAQNKMNALGRKNIPFFFILSFDLQKNIVVPLDHCAEMGIAFQFPGISGGRIIDPQKKQAMITDFTLPGEGEYQQAFKKVQYHLHRGDTYLLNLSFEVPIQMNTGLDAVYRSAGALFKTYWAPYWISFSPERFVDIEGQTLSTHPMKGTISSEFPEAAERLLNDKKENAEHYTIVDLMRNDLSSVGRQTRVEKFKYLTEVQREGHGLLQMSSHIKTQLPEDWTSHLGDIFFRLLPAGSITGAPKQKTVDIIEAVETHQREFYTGVSGVFYDGKVDSAILIRYIGQRNGQCYYKTGGGITTQSQWEDEYNEIREKSWII
jgi:para-aminobenzoate synthetase component 1